MVDVARREDLLLDQISDYIRKRDEALDILGSIAVAHPELLDDLLDVVDALR